MLFRPARSPCAMYWSMAILTRYGGASCDDRVADQRQERADDVPLVRAQVRQQAAHQPRVVGLAEDFFFVE